MKKAFTKDPRLERVTRLCRVLPEAIFELTGKHASYQVRKKTFAYYLNDHHGDGIISVCCKVLPGDNAALITAQPKKFYMPAYIGPRGWVALRLDIPGVDWNEVNELIRTSYRLVAPQKLAGVLPSSSPRRGDTEKEAEKVGRKTSPR
jgi:predicted DNA-binding protein (MmcQ/YjbR family)